LLGLTIAQFLIASLAALLVGMAKGGLKGISIISVALMALVYGAKASTGVLLTLLISITTNIVSGSISKSFCRLPW